MRDSSDELLSLIRHLHRLVYADASKLFGSVKATLNLMPSFCTSCFFCQGQSSWLKKIPVDHHACNYIKEPSLRTCFLEILFWSMQLHSATIFSKLDLRSAYRLVKIQEGYKWKTAFKTTLGPLKYLVMLLGSQTPQQFSSP